MRSAVVVVALLLLTGTSVAQQPEVTPFTKVQSEGIERSNFEFSVSGYKYTILSNGRGRREGGQGPVRRFNLRLLKNDYLEQVLYHAEYRGDLLLICEISDGESGAGFITRLNGQTLAMKWKRSIPAFNVGQGLMESNHAYVTGIGFVGKVNLESGAYAWKHDNLYRSGYVRDRVYGDSDFNSFELPKIEADTVLFKEVETNDRPPKTLTVHKRTGRVISIN